MGKNKLIRHNDGTTSCPNCGDSDHECLAPTEPQHTPIPWQVRNNIPPYFIIDKEMTLIIDAIESKELADYIVKAVNSHDALVELLNYVIKEIENTPDELSDALLGLIKIKAKTALSQVEKG